MKDYFRNDITLSINFEGYKDLLNEQYSEVLLVSNYDSSLIYNQRKPEYLQLTIYYIPSQYLFEKLEILIEKKIDILHLIKPKLEKKNWEFPDILDFSESNLISISESHYWEHNKKQVILTIDNLNILINGRYFGDGRFQLTENIFQHIEKYIQYGHLGRLNYDDKFIENYKNRETNFGISRFILSFEHWFNNSKKFNIDISRDVYLTITDSSETLTDLELIELGNSICLLMSFYWQKTIDFFNARVRINNNDNYKTREVLKYSSHLVDENDDSLLKKQFNTFYDFIDQINFKRFTKNQSLIKEIVPRIIRSKNVDDISAFMILYNIIEKIRNYCMSVQLMDKKLTIKEEFSFIKGKKATDKFITNKLKEINEIVEESDNAEFLAKVNDKVNFIKKTGLIDQFDSLITYLEIDANLYEINFNNLIKARNNIYHGKPPNENINSYNNKMIVIIYDMIIKMITY
ncbi:MAG: hypothetical protein NTZ33_04920 [Bacteroidetes bacterium]|nr:hypothetical protein [Bacteroidota bacterium]